MQCHECTGSIILPGGCFYGKTLAECNQDNPDNNNHLPAFRARLTKILVEHHMARPGSTDEIYVRGKLAGFMCAAKHILPDAEYSHLFYLCWCAGLNNYSWEGKA